MKKILFTILLAFFGVISANAQEIDSLQIKSDTISIERLVARIDKLQYDYDFLYCRSQLDRLLSELENMMLNIRIEYNSITSAYFNHSKPDVDYYIACKDLYESNKNNFDLKKLNASVVKSFVSLKISFSNFSEVDTNILNTSLTMIEKNVAFIEKLFDSYKNVIEMYKEK